MSTIGRVAVPQTSYSLSRVAYGGLHFGEFQGKEEELEKVIDTALEQGITTFDLADVYGWYRDGEGRSNDALAVVLAKRPDLRPKMELCCKFGIKLDGGYHVDTSKEWIEHSLSRYLERFNTTYVDIFMFHNPNPGMDANQVADAFKAAYDAGKVRMFGVSNFHEWEYKPLKEAMEARGLRLSVVQLETSLYHPEKITDGTVDMYKKEEMVILGWGPVGGDPYGGKNLLIKSEGEKERKVVKALEDKGAATGGASWDQVAVAWVLQHPTNIIPILGTTKSERVKSQSTGALALPFTEQDYNGLLQAVTN